MALTPGKMEVDVAFDPERIARDLANSLAGALADITGALLNYANPDSTNPDSTPPDAFITDWPLKTRAPKMIVTCPTCFQSVEGEPLSWEIVLSPLTSQISGVRGLFMHAHDDTQIETRWPFAVDWEEPKRRPTFTHDPVIGEYTPDDDIEEGQERSVLGDPWDFTPETYGTLSLRSAVMQALGGASTCWDENASLSGFNSERAVEIGEALLKVIEQQRPERGEDESVRQRLSTWEAVASHPYMRRAYEQGATLHEGVIARLDEAQSLEAERVRLQQIIYRARTYVRAEIERAGEPLNDMQMVETILGAVDA